MSVTIALCLAIPALAIPLLALSGRWPNLREAITLIAAGLLLIAVYSLLPEVLAGERPSLRIGQIAPGLLLHFTVEPLGMLFAGLAALLWPINSLYSIGYMRGNQEAHQTRFYICFAIAIFSAIGIAFAANLLTLFIFYELLSLSTYPLVTHKGTSDALRAGRVYLGILIGSSIGFFLLAIIWTWLIAGSGEFTPGGLLANKIEGPEVGILLGLYAFGIGKAALMPLHRWLPAAMVAPTPVSALLHAVAVVKAGVFSLLKVLIYIFGLNGLRYEASAHWLLYVALFSLVVASVIALRQDNLKRRLAYSTIGQLAYVVLAGALFTPIAAMAGALHIIAHGLGKITLFFAAGAIYTASHKSEISQLDGIGRRMPWTMGAFAIGSLSMIGLPPAMGLVSKWYLVQGVMQQQAWLVLAGLVVSTLLNAAYFLPIVYRAFFCAPRPLQVHHAEAEHGEAPTLMVVALSLTAALTVLSFIWPDIPLALAKQLVENCS